MISNYSNPVQWRQAVTTTAKPLSQVTKSSANTTFGVDTVVDASAWDLSNVQQGDTLEVVDAVTGEIFEGKVLSVDDPNDTITLVGSTGWVKAAVAGRSLADMKPADGSVVIVHRLDKCVYLVIDGLIVNSADVFLGFDDTVTDGSGANPGHPISNNAGYANFRMEMEAGLDRFLDLKNMFVIAAASQALSIIAM